MGEWHDGVRKENKVVALEEGSEMLAGNKFGLVHKTHTREEDYIQS